MPTAHAYNSYSSKPRKVKAIWIGNFDHNFRKAQQYGLVRGAYHYFSPGISGDLQAHHFINSVPLEKGDLPPVLDVEVLADSSQKR